MPGERRRPAKASERLRRLLTIVPYVVRHPGARIPEVCELFDLSREELLEDLRLIWTSGLPPYGPGDLMDVLIEGDRIWIRMAETFARPLRLSRGEAIALYLRAKALVGEPGLAEAPALASALGKLERGLGEDALAGLTGRVETADGGRVDEDVLEDLRAAARVHERIRIEYYAASSAETSIREVDPEEVFTAIGRWYVVAWDHRAADERLFRVDRIRSVEPIGVTFEPRGLLGAGRPLYSRTPSDVPVRLLLGPSARWVAEYYEVEEAVERDGGLEVVLPAGRLEWVARLVVRLGGEATVVEPPELVSAARDLAERTLARYRGGTRRRS